jgi:glycine cleavage system aminomethyltransferase T
VTSACVSALAGGVLGLGYVASRPATDDLVDFAGRIHGIHEVGLPVFDPEKRRPRGSWTSESRPDNGGTSH